MRALAEGQRFEHAAVVRDRVATVVRACARMQRLAALSTIAELVAAQPDGAGGWLLAVVRHGRLAAAGVAARGVAPWPVVEALQATADVVVPGPGPIPVALAEETECVLRWLEQPGARLVLASQPWAMPAFGAGSLRAFLGSDARAAADPFADRRRLRVSSRPARASA